jgi:putative hemolysin
MSTILISECLALGLLFVFSAFFSSAETALFSLNPIQLRRLWSRHPRAARRVSDMLQRPTRLLSTLLIGNTLVNVAAAGLGYAIAKQFVPAYAEFVSIVTMTLLLLVLGEVAPKRLAMLKAETLSALYAPVLTWLIAVSSPLRSLLERLASLFVPNLHAANRTLTEDEFLSVIEVGEEEGVLDEEERTMVDGIIAMEERQASDVMTPRVDLVGIDLDDPPDEQEHVARSVTYRYLPLYRDTLDNVEGFLDVPTYLLNGAVSIEDATVPVCFVPETAPLDNLLLTFQEENRRVAIVADEYGGTAGLITRGDILEEIVEDVEGEHGEEEPEIRPAGPEAWLIDGMTSLEDVNYELDLDLEAEGADRIAGWVIAQAERIPHAGDVVEAQGCRVRVELVRRQRIMEVLLEKLAKGNGSPKGRTS